MSSLNFNGSRLLGIRGQRYCFDITGSIFFDIFVNYRDIDIFNLNVLTFPHGAVQY